MFEQVTTGSTVAGFLVEALIGEGATGKVYRASDHEHGQVALKVLAPELAHDDRFRQRFLRESRLAAGLAHPHIVPVLEAGEEDGIIYLALRLVDGPDLREILQRQPRLEPDLALAIGGQVADALDAAHGAGLVHRDVKPANVLLEGEHAYLCDFGLARHVSSVSSLTTERGFVGTIDYIAPEQIEGGSIDRRVDVYSLGCVLYECLTGAKPFDRESDLATVFAHLNEAPPEISAIFPELPKELDAVFSTALAKAPEERYSSCGDLIAAARAGLEGKTFVPRRRRRRRLIGVGALAAVVAAAVIAIVVTDSGSSTKQPAAGTSQPDITSASIDGVPLGRPAAFYENALGGYKQSVLDAPFSNKPLFPELSFQQPSVGIYFPKHSRRAFLVTTWNRAFRTSAGIGPCSTLAQMHRVYGSRVVPAYSGTDPNNPKVHGSWQLGRNLLFMTQDQKTISSVVLFKGPANARAKRQPPGTHQGWANYVGADETACK